MLPVAFDEPLEVRAMDDNDFVDFHSFRFHVPERVQALILIALHVNVMIARLPTALGGRDRQRHDLSRVQAAAVILLLVRRVILREDCRGSREQHQKRLDSGFCEDCHVCLGEAELETPENLTLQQVNAPGVSRLSGMEHICLCSN